MTPKQFREAANGPWEAPGDERPLIEVPPELEDMARKLAEGTDLTVHVNPRLLPTAWRYWAKPEVGS